MVDTYPETFAFVQFHGGDGYGVPWGNDRFNFYGVQYTPTMWYDGLIERVGAQPYATYQSLFLTRRAIPTDVTIEVAGAQVSGPTYRIQATVCLEAGGTAKTLRLYIVQVLNHWPASPTYSRNGFKQAAATEDITLSPGQCQVVSREITFDEQDSWPNQENIRIIVWAQAPLSSGPAEVYQAAIMPWPFEPPDCNHNNVDDALDVTGGTSEDCNLNSVPDECEADCNGNTVPDDCDLTGGTSLDCNGSGRPDECELDGNDCNGNSTPDECDQALLITMHPENQRPCPGLDATFTVTAPGATGYQWYHDGSPVGGATSDSLTVVGATGGDEGAYTCLVSKDCIDSESDPALLTLAEIPQQQTAPGSLTKCEGDRATFIVEFDGDEPMSYQWEKDGVPIDGATGETFTMAVVTAADAGAYRCRATNVCDYAYSDEATLTIDPSPIIVNHPDSQCVDTGETAVLSVFVAGEGSFFYKWYKDDVKIVQGEGLDTLTLDNVQAADAGDYHVTVQLMSAPECQPMSERATLQVDNCPECDYAVAGDMTGDNDVDLEDFRLFQACFGTAMAPVLGCECANLDDGDEDINLSDFVMWESAFGGP